jgi:hypothetical protein
MRRARVEGNESELQCRSRSRLEVEVEKRKAKRYEIKKRESGRAENLKSPPAGSLSSLHNATVKWLLLRCVREGE